MLDSTSNVKSIFGHALEISSSKAREKYLEEACHGNSSLRREVEDLIGAVGRAGDFLLPDPPDEQLPPRPVGEEIGSLIGPYKLLEQIGEGGMGLVYMAEQQQPIRRLAALKIVKPGMDSRQVIARFEAERQALAMLDHANVAKVLDAGTTDAGRLYFVMELVKGVPITRFCDENRLTVQQRLELFVPVCQAIQHAHQKGIIHRDIKPTNVLVALYDGVPVPKVIDFGVAKATGQKLTDKTLFTGFGHLIGTLEYMSPEQAQFNQLDIDTRSDVYSLGVLLYELLTGTTPLEQSRLRTAAIDETLRIIRQEEPPKPSTRLSAAETLPAIATNRNVKPIQLRRLVTGDLDWIVMKCLEKDRNRRYESASGLATDIRHYLRGEPVNACSPSVLYRLRKYLLRNKGSLAVGAALLMAVLAAAGALGWVLRDRAARELEITRSQSERRIEIERQARDSLTMARELVAGGKVASAREKLMQSATGLYKEASAFADLIAEIEVAQKDLDRFTRFLDLIDQANQAETAPRDSELAADSTFEPDFAPLIRIGERRPEAAVPLLLQALDCYSVLDRDDWQQKLRGSFLASQQTEQIRRNSYEVLLWLANDLVRFRHDYQIKKPLSAEEAARQSLVCLQKAENTLEPTQALYLLRARCHETLGNSEAAQVDKQQAGQTSPAIAFDHFLRGQAAWDAKELTAGVAAFEAALRVEPTHYWSMIWLGYSLAALGQPDDYVSAVRVFTGCILKRPDHAHAYYYRAFSYRGLQRDEEALADYTKAITLDPKHSGAWHDRAIIHSKHGRYGEALAGYSKAIELNPQSAPAWAGRGVSHNDLNQPEKALEDLAKAIELNPQSAYAWNGVGVAHVKLNRREEALADFNKAIEFDPKFWAAWFNRGDRYRALGQDDKALADYSKAIELNPQYASAWFERGVSFNQLNQPDKALADFAKAIELNPQRAAAWNGRGVALLKLNRGEEALADFNKAIELDPRFWRAWHNRGTRYNTLGQKDKALTDYSKAIELNPKYAPAWSGRAATYKDLNQDEKAVADFSKAIEIDPTLPRGWFGRADCYYRMRRYEEALADYSMSIELDPNTSRLWYARGLVHKKLNQPENALADYNKAIELNPRDGSTYNNLAWLLTTCSKVALRDPQRAVALAEKAVEIYPPQGIFWHTLGVARYRVDNWEAAIAALEKAKKLRGEDPLDGFVLAMARWKLGHYDEARTIYKNVLQFIERRKEDIEKNPGYLEELLSFREEAEALLGPSPSNE
jgi:tetratricopeptide (TPR) repeat protein/serine/threonine protein kinase